MYKIKSKVIDGKVVYGIIDEDLNELAEFKYKEISPVAGNADVLLLRGANNKIDVFMNGQVISTKYTELIFVPSQVCGYADLFIGKTSRKSELVFISEKYMEKGLDIHVFDFKKILGKDSKTKIDDIELEEDGVCLYSNTEKGMLKGYFGHKILGHLEPKYIDIESYSYEAVRPYRPKFNKNERYTMGAEKDWSSRYAIVTKMVKGKLKKGIIIRKKGEYGDKWEELVPCKYDDIIPNENGDFITINNKNRKPKKGLIHMTTYYDMYSKGMNLYGCASLKVEFELEPEFDEIKRLVEINAEFISESDYIYYIVKKNNKYGLYKSRTMKARGNCDYLDNNRPYGPLLDKMLDCEYDDIESNVSKLRLKDYERKHLIETFKATKGEKSLLVFDRQDINDNYIKTECAYKDADIFYNGLYYATNTLIDEAGLEQFVDFEAVPETLGAWQTTKYQLKLTSKYKYTSIVDTKSNYKLLVGEYEDGKIDVFDQYMNQKCDRVDFFKTEDYYCISKKKIEEDESSVNSLTIYNKSCVPIHTFRGYEITYSYSEKTHSVYVSVDGRVYIVDLYDQKVIDGEFSYIEIIDELMLYQQESGYGLNRLTKDGLINILEPIYESIQILPSIKRLIVATKDEAGNIKYGVRESNKGNKCLDIMYDSIDLDNDRFVCTIETQTLYYDLDGFLEGYSLDNQAQLKKC